MNEKIKTKPGFPRLVPDEDICQETSDGIIITVEVSAGSKREMFPNGYNPWRKAFGIALGTSSRRKSIRQLLNHFRLFFRSSVRSR